MSCGPTALEGLLLSTPQAAPEDTYQQANCGHALMDGGKYKAELGIELARWSTIITDDARSMESRMENRLCRWVRPSPELCWCNSLRARGRVSRLVVRCADGDVYRGLAYNERCFGTLW